MLINLGIGALVITLAVTLYGSGAAAYGALRKADAWIESARLAMALVFPLLSMAVACLLVLLATGRFEVQYVASVASSSMPLALRLTALWAGQAGSLLFWSWLLAGFASAAALRNWKHERDFLPWVVVVVLVTLAFFLVMSVFLENPFERYWQMADGRQVISLFQPAGGMVLIPADGLGMNPLLRHAAMVLHPPALYLGFVAFVIPYAFAMAALITRQGDDRWMRVTRRWSLAAWLFLSLGLLVGMRWAYDVLGWGGYWGWDPVEIAALMPWLSGTAYLHSVMIQEKRGLFKRWNVVLIILTYSLVIFGTFLTRSGVLSSVHAFSASTIGGLFFGFIALTLLASLGLLLARWHDLRSEGQMTSLLSREAFFLVNNLLFMGILVVCFWGVIFPLLSELVTGQKVTVGPPFYERAAGPLFAALVLLMGVAPLSAWGHSTLKTLGRGIWLPLAASLALLAGLWLGGVRAPMALLGFWLAGLAAFITLYEYGRSVRARCRRTGEGAGRAFWQLARHNRRRYGGYIIHIGVVLMALGVIGIEMFQTETQATLPVGGSLRLDGYTLTYRSLSDFEVEGRNVARAVVEVEKSGRSLGVINPRWEYYYDSRQGKTVPGLRSTLADDLFVLLVDWQPVTSLDATFKVYHNPLVAWLWIGGLVFTLGTLVAALPDREAKPAA